jgi:hypothetical protein
MKKHISLFLGMALSLGCAMTAFAGEWQQPSEGTWKWKNDDSTYAANGWYWLDGNQDGIAECYYFNESGTLLTNTTTPDLYTVNGDGQWTVNGVVQTQASTQAPAQAAILDAQSLAGTYNWAEEKRFSSMTNEWTNSEVYSDMHLTLTAIDANTLQETATFDGSSYPEISTLIRSEGNKWIDTAYEYSESNYGYYMFENGRLIRTTVYKSPQFSTEEVLTMNKAN